MKIMDIESELNVIAADASAIKVLTCEVSEEVTPNSNEYFKLHTVYTLADHQLELAEKLIEELVTLRDKVKED